MDPVAAENQTTIAWYSHPGGRRCLSVIEVWGESGTRHTKIRWVADRPYPQPQVHEMISLLELMAIASNGGMSVPRSGRRTRFAIGQRWACVNQHSHRAAFDFVIVGRGSDDHHKLCALEPWSEHDRVRMPHTPSRAHNDPIVMEYSHRHLSKHGKLVEEPRGQRTS